MNVLESFFFQFVSDTSNVKKGVEEGRKGAKELKASLDEADDSAGKLGEGLTKLAKEAGAAMAAFYAIYKLKEITQQTADHTFAISQQAKALTMSTEKLSSWQNAVRMSGGSAEGATKSLEVLRDKFVEMSRFGGVMGQDAMMLQKLGLSAKDMHESIKDPLIAMDKLNLTFSKLDSTQQMYLGQKLGLDIGTIALLSQTREQYTAMIAKQKELGVVTQEQALAAQKFKMQEEELKIVFEGVSRELVSLFLPALTWVLEAVEKGIQFFREHKVFAVSFFTAIAAVMAAVFLPAIIESTVAMASFAVATLTAAAPFILIGVAIAAVAALIALLVDDIWHFINGQDSLIGDAVKKWPILGQIFHALGQIFKMVWDGIKVIFDFWVWYFTKGLPDAAMFLHDKVVGFFDSMGKKFPWLAEVLRTLKDDMVKLVGIMTEPWEFLWEMIKKVFNTLKEAPIWIINMVGKGLAAVTGGKYDPISSTPAASSPTDAAAKAASDIKTTAQGSGTFKGVPEDIQAAAKASEAKYGVPAAVTIAQWTLESGMGKHMPTGSNNPFGIKARAGEDFVEAMTTEHIGGRDVQVMQKFKKFKSMEEAFDEHAKLLATKKAYAKAQANTGDANAYADSLTGVYATDPNYGTKLKRIMAEQGAANVDAANGKMAIASANANPVNNTNSSVITNSKNSSRGDTHVNVGGVTVQTQSTDPNAIHAAAANGMATHMKNAVDQYDDGVAA